MTNRWESRAIALEATNPLGAQPMSEDNEARWQAFANEVAGHTYNEVFLAWADPLVVEPGIRSRLVASLTAPMDAAYPNVTSHGSLKVCFVHEAMGKGNTPPDLQTFIADRPELALELAQGILNWRATSVTYNDYDRRDENWVIEQIHGAVEQQNPDLAAKLTIRPLIGDTLDTRPPKDVARETKQRFRAMSETTPEVYLDNWYQGRDRYHDLAIALQDPTIDASVAAAITQQWINRVDKDEENYPGRDTWRLRRHVEAMAKDEASNPDMLTAIVGVLHESGEPRDSFDRFFRADVALRVTDDDIKEALVTKIVMQRVSTGFSIKDADTMPRELADIDERRAAEWLRSRLTSIEGRTPDQDVALETCDSAIRHYDAKARVEARRDVKYRAAQAAVRHTLRGGDALTFDYAI